MKTQTCLMFLCCWLAVAPRTHANPDDSGGEEQSFSVEELHAESTYLVLCAKAGGEAWINVARRLARARKSRAIVFFDTDQTEDLLPLMGELKPKIVAYVMPPQLINPHLCGELAELASRIDPDKLVDYASGYVTGVTADDATALIERTLKREDADVPIPRICTGVGHSWYDSHAVHLILASRETGHGPILKLASAGGKETIVKATADVSIVESVPDQSYQVRGLDRRLMLTPTGSSLCLIAFDSADFKTEETDPWKSSILEILVDATRWQFNGTMVVGASPLQDAWEESSTTWNDAPAFKRDAPATVSVDALTTTVRIDVTSLMDNLQHGLALYCHSSEDKSTKPLRHMHQFMSRYVEECRDQGFDGSAIEALRGSAWTQNRLEMLAPMGKGGLILFGGHGSGASSCIVDSDDLQSLEIGPSVVLNGTCFGATTHEVVSYGEAGKPHSRLRTMDPSESFALQMLRRGSLGCIGGSTKCSFGHVLPAIKLLRDEHMSLGESVRAIQNGFIENVPTESWEAGGMRPGDPGFAKIDQRRESHPTIIQYTIRTICLGDPAFVPFPE